MTSISSTGGVTPPSFEPEDPSAQPAADTGAPEAAPTVSRVPTSLGPASRLLADLQSIADEKHRPWVADALSGWFPGLSSEEIEDLVDRYVDGADNVTGRAAELRLDGRVTADEVRSLVTEAHDHDEMRPAEKEALTAFLRQHAGEFEVPARQALAGFLGVDDPLAGSTPAVGLLDVGLDGFKLHPDGYGVASGGVAGPPGSSGEGAERIYRFGEALVEAPRGVMSRVPAGTQARLLENAERQYAQALSEVQTNRVAPLDAHRVRAGAVATLVALVEGAATPEIKQRAAQALLAQGLQEPLEGLRAHIYLQLEQSGSGLPAAARADLARLKERVLPTKPPYDAWFGGGNDLLEVRHYAHDDCWTYSTPPYTTKARDPVSTYRDMGLEVKEHGTEPNGDEFWVLDGTIKSDGKEQRTRVRLVRTHDEFMRDMDDEGTHVVYYTGHSNLGGNVSEAVRRGPEENGSKLLYLGMCRGQQNVFEVANKYPNAHLTTSYDPPTFPNLMDRVEAQLLGIARRDTYEGIDRATRLYHRSESVNNLIRPDELRRYELTDLDLDGTPEIGLDVRDRFFDVVARRPPMNRTDLVPRAESRKADEIPGAAIMNGVCFARTLLTYHVEKSHEPSPLDHIEGDRIEAAGWFEGSDEPVRITETTGRDGRPVYNVSVNKAYADQSAYAIGALIQYKAVEHFLSQDGELTAEDKGHALMAVGEYLAYMYCSVREARAITRSLGELANVGGLSYDILAAAKDAGGGGYVNKRQVQYILDRVRMNG
ncbi:hypothetical protein ACFL59_10210 [Planctomycetota bacterium]